MGNNTVFRPWGELNWLLSKTPETKFDLITCLSTEDRCLNTYSILDLLGYLEKICIYEIVDPEDTGIHKKLRDNNRSKLNTIHLPSIELHKLLEPTNIIRDSILSFINNSSGNIILDISTFPKRFFFPITKLLLRANNIQNFFITCSTPLEYTKDYLSEDPQAWAHLPTFVQDDPDTRFDLAIVGIGFMPLGLPQLLKDKYSSLKVKYLFPFPPGPPTYQRTWAFVNQMNTSTNVDTRQILRIDALDLSEIFNLIGELTDRGVKNALFAPYGPKTMSLAMCIYASLTNSPVYYTQPNKYNPHYSTGIGSCIGYIIIQGGKSLYTV